MDGSSPDNANILQDKVVGFGCAREVAGGYVLPILVGPLYADDLEAASALLYALLKKYYVRIRFVK